MEIAHWLQEESLEAISADATRFYVGHESCADRFPQTDILARSVRDLVARGKGVTLVIPPLTESDLCRIYVEVERAVKIAGNCEVVCNDWGVLQWLAESALAEPVAGRLLSGQATDPRLDGFDSPALQEAHERSVIHADGTIVDLHYRRPSHSLMKRLRGCPIATRDVLRFLQDFGVRRFEISNILQGISPASLEGWGLSLHIPRVPVAISRYPWKEAGRKWLHHSFQVELLHEDNMVFYLNSHLPEDLEALGVDRLVYRHGD
jgi:hypothetical protein